MSEPDQVHALLRALSAGDGAGLADSTPELAGAALGHLAAHHSAPAPAMLAALDQGLQLRLLRLASGADDLPPPWSEPLRALIDKHRHLLGVQAERYDRRWAFLLDVLARWSPVPASAAPVLSAGQVVRGVVRNIFDGGAFLVLDGGAIALLQLADIAWQRLEHPSDALQAGEPLDVRVLAVDVARNRISVGLKQLGPDPWMGITRRLRSGTRRIGRIVDIGKFGSFVELEPGIDGLVHVSDMSELQRQQLAVGAEVEVRVLAVDFAQRRVSLSMLPAAISDPFDQFAMLHQPGDVLAGDIAAITETGLFLRLAEGVTGFLHRDELPGRDDGKDWRQSYARNLRLQVLIRAIDSEKQRVSLGRVPAPSPLVSPPPRCP